MLLDRLKLNDDKTENPLIGTRHKLDKLCDVSLAVDDHLIAPRQVAKNLGVGLTSSSVWLQTSIKYVVLLIFIYII